MERVAKFEKVSYEQFKKDYTESILSDIAFMNEEVQKVIQENARLAYYNIKLPSRATSGSAGYDFFTPISFTLRPTKSIVIPTGIRVKMDDGWVLQCFPRSGLGSKYRLQLDNTVGVIDSDYYYSDNEGHIFAKITNDSKAISNDVMLQAGQAFMQGIFIRYGITEDDNATATRNGGFGSTD